MANAYRDGETIHLEMTEVEARVLRTILGRIGGSDRDTLRRYTNSMCWQLEQFVRPYMDEHGKPPFRAETMEGGTSLWFLPDSLKYVTGEEVPASDDIFAR